MSNSRKRKLKDIGTVELHTLPSILSNTDETVSKYFNDDTLLDKTQKDENAPIDFTSRVLSAVEDLNSKLKCLKFSIPAKIIYNPTEYAFDSLKNFILKFGNKPKNILFLGMNPGPWGMSQTGVPFGEINAVKDWLKITGTINKPPIEDPNRPVLGFECKRSEVSGKRFWELAKFLSKTPETFFKNCYVHNYCPLQFIGTNGKNVTPEELKIGERDVLYKICDENLTEIIKIFNCKILIGIGKFAETRFKKLVKAYNILDVEIFSIPHPSPRAVGNKDWQNKTHDVLKTLNLVQHFTD